MAIDGKMVQALENNIERPIVRAKHEKHQSNDPQKEPGQDLELVEGSEQWLVCVHCGRGITQPPSRISIDGGYKHTFANPHGIVFEIGCFTKAVGCLPIGEASDEFSWFRGYKWRIVICAGCSTHLGWRFESGLGDNFYGLILDRLRQISFNGKPQ